MSREWILQLRETKRRLASSTWIPLRASQSKTSADDATQIGYREELFCAGCVAIPPEHKAIGDGLGWRDIGLIHNVAQYASEDGWYKPVDAFQFNEKETVGVEFIFEHPQHGAGPRKWVINPDLYIALGLIKEGDNWVRPEEDFAIAIRESFGSDGRHSLIEIKREFLIDYLAARGLALRVAIYRQHVENVAVLDASPYAELNSHAEERDEGRFELSVRNASEIWGGPFAVFKAWRSDVDAEEDVPVMGPETNENVGFESSRGVHDGYAGVRVAGEFWREEWIDHVGLSTRVRGDRDPTDLEFIIDSSGSRLPSSKLRDDEIGRWLWFRPQVLADLVRRRGFSLEWYTAETAALRSATGDTVHFGFNDADYVTVYASDIARLPVWQQRVWLAHNASPEGKVSGELLRAQVQTSPASTRAPEDNVIEVIVGLGNLFEKRYGEPLYTHPLDLEGLHTRLARFMVDDQVSMLRLAKELVRSFTDRLSVSSLRKISSHPDKAKLGSNKLLESVVAADIGPDSARELFGVIAGVYDMRLGDAHPVSSKIEEAFALVGIDRRLSHLQQAKQMIDRYAYTIWRMCMVFYKSGKE